MYTTPSHLIDNGLMSYDSKNNFCFLKWAHSTIQTRLIAVNLGKYRCYSEVVYSSLNTRFVLDGAYHTGRLNLAGRTHEEASHGTPLIVLVVLCCTLELRRCPGQMPS
jgi:hypothetical protein